jgi:hypothetical protein
MRGKQEKPTGRLLRRLRWGGGGFRGGGGWDGTSDASAGPTTRRQIGESAENAGGESGSTRDWVGRKEESGLDPFTHQILQRTNAKGPGQQRRWWFACVWRRKSFLTAVLQDSLQRSTAGRPQLRGLTETGEQRTPRRIVCSRWPLLLQTACPMLLHCQCAMGVAGKLFRRDKL